MYYILLRLHDFIIKLKPVIISYSFIINIYNQVLIYISGISISGPFHGGLIEIMPKIEV